MTAGPGRDAPIRAVRARAYAVPTDGPEADGTLAWSSTTLVVAEVEAGGETGFGLTYGAAAAAGVIRDLLAPVAARHDAFDVPAATRAMTAATRNVGQAGIAACAVSAMDLALWDLKARLLGLPLCTLLGRLRTTIPVYGSGGLTTYGDARLADQLGGWARADGCRAVKMKIGTDPARDPDRMAVARAAIGDAALFVDANGAFTPRAALALAERAAEHDVRWFEEPVSGDDLAGLRFVRERAPAAMEIAAGEYLWALEAASRTLAAGAVDVLQADATRCGGITGFLAIAGLCDAAATPLSGHCAPAMHLHAACAAPRLRHLEWFHDHVRIESMLLDGAPTIRDGAVRPDLGRPGHGLAFRAADAERFAVRA